MSFAIYPMRGYPVSAAVGRVGRAAAGLTIALAALIALASAAPAQTASRVFSVTNISVDESADTAAAARAAAFRRGQREALSVLLRRLTLRSDHARLPEVERERLEFMVQALGVSGEKTSNVRYLADMTVTFKPQEVRRLLREAGIPFAESPSKPVLVLPVMQQGGGLVLWDDPNIWREAWSRLSLDSALVPLVVPVGDLSDISDVDAEQAVEGDPLRLSAIASRYGAGDVLVAIATLSQAGGVTRVDITASRIGSPAQTTILRSFQTPDPGALPALMGDAAANVAAAVEEAWKAANIIEFDRPGRLLLAVPLTSLEQWVSVERRLNSIASISDVSLISLTRDAAEVAITHFGDEAQLAAILAQRDLALEQPTGLAAALSAPYRSVQTDQALRRRVLRPIAP